MFIENRYEILEKVGTGGMSDVFKARDHKLGRLVAIKFLKQEFCEDKNFVSNFQVEAQSAAALLHPNVVSVYDVNETNGTYYIVMEYVDGITLKKYISINGRLPIKEATSIAIQVAQGMEAAHNAGIVHRDIKPQNVLISREGKIKVTDFGIARATTANTISADVLGSAQYISPEQARGDKVDVRSDIYSFGIMFYEMVTGQLPFDGDSPVTIVLKHIQEKVPLAGDVAEGIPGSVEKIIEKCTQKKPEKRYQKVSFLLSDLKTSLVSPNEDFVVMNEAEDDGATIVMSGNDLKRIREETEDDYYDDDEEYDESSEYEDEDVTGKRFDRILKICGIAAGVIIVVILIIVGIKTFGSGGCFGSSDEDESESETEETVMVEVIDVTGLTLAQATRKLEALGLVVETEYVESDEVDEDEVISQSPGEGEEVEEGSVIVLTVSAGVDTVILSDYSGMSQSAATEALKALGLTVTVTEEYSDDVDTGDVIETDPAAGSEVAVGSEVELVISRGQETVYVTVPSCTGYKESEAEALCEDRSLNVEIVYQEDADNVGLVISQSIGAGTSVEEGTTITLYVGTEPETTTVATVNVPSCIGLTESDAVSACESKGLVVTVSYSEISSGSSNVGKVIDQSLTSGSTVEEGSSITLVVGVAAQEDADSDADSDSEAE